MKRILLLGAAAAAMLAAQAREVTPQEALDRLCQATPSMRAAGLSQTNGARLAFTETTPQQGSPAVYVFNRADGAGFFVVPADDEALPLLGYSDGGEFVAENMPPQMSTWLGEYARQIEWAREHPATISLGNGSNGSNRSASYEADWAPIEPICKTKWDQGAPYWNECPVTDGRRCYTGCVATAMAQVMKVYNHPVNPTGSVSYNDKGTNRTMNFNGLTFDWENMLDNYARVQYSDEQAAAVALLMKACGYAAHMGYTPDGSGAQETVGVAGMKQYFDYSTNAQVLDRNYFPLDEWEQMLYTNLQAGCPVLYTGFTADWSGHAFILDGYSTDGFYHLNWGWSGAYDGYFRVFGLNPEGFGAGGAEGGYNMRQSAAFGLQPTELSTLTPYHLSMVQNGSLKGTISSSRLTLRTSGGSPAYLFYNLGTSGRFDFAAAIKDSEGNVNYVILSSNEYLITGKGVGQKAFTLPSDIATGTYEVSTVWRTTGTEEWKTVRPQVGCTTSIRLTRAEDGSYTVADPIINMPVASDPEYTNFFVGRKTRIKVTLTNPADGIEYLNTVTVGLFSNSSSPDQVGRLTDEQPLDLAAGTSQVIEFNGYFLDMDNKKATADSYLMGFFDSATGQQLGDELYPITIKANPGYATLRRDEFFVNGDPTAVSAEELSFTVKVTCTKGYYDDVLTVTVYDSATQKMGQAISEPLELSRNESVTITLPMQLPAAGPGEYKATLSWVKSTSLSSNTMQLGSPISFTIVDPAGVEIVAEDAEAESTAAVYTIDGRLARAAGSDAPLAPGFYIRDGQKFIVR